MRRVVWLLSWLLYWDRWRKPTSMFFEQLANSGSYNRIIAVNCVGRPSQRMWRRQHQNQKLLRLKSAIFLLKCRLRCCSEQQDWYRGENEWDGTLPRDARGLWKRPGQLIGVCTEIGEKFGRIRIYYAFNCHSYGVPCCPESSHPSCRQTLRVRGFLPSSKSCTNPKISFSQLLALLLSLFCEISDATNSDN